ncbi:hypothetical protein ACLI09_10140 [Flavobacterium sp. RHBU_24]|uniref:hypothetical protein n=1 Tax=Flavobacterium sp. RHBU_24 TaxID=3391185 RepID=UPI003984C567
MKKIYLLSITFFVLYSCSNKLERQAISEKYRANVLDSQFPLRLATVNLDNDKHSLALDDNKVFKIEKVIKDFVDENVLSDDPKIQADAYLRTIRLFDEKHTLYVILLKSYPTDEVTARVLIYDNNTHEYLKDTFDLKLYALYDYDNGALTPTNLRRQFKITSPEIELTDFNWDSINDYKFTRLWHNGTFNAIHTTIISVANAKIDTLSFEEKVIGRIEN